jgi:hypothetical protein
MKKIIQKEIEVGKIYSAQENIDLNEIFECVSIDSETVVLKQLTNDPLAYEKEIDGTTHFSNDVVYHDEEWYELNKEEIKQLTQ